MNLMSRLPELIVFISSFSLLLLELTAARLVARHIGSSLETWSAVIGILLGGIAVGNAVGGTLADRGHPGKICSLMLLAGAILCCSVLPLTHFAGMWSTLSLPWLLQVTLVTFTVLFPAAFVLGTLSPSATRLALEQDRPIGRTMGSMYAWSALGGILGTYLTGFVFFSYFPLEQVILVTSGVLLGMSLLCFLAQGAREQ